MPRAFIRLAALFGAAGVIAFAAGFNPETGSYVFKRYSLKEFGASPQSWSVAQDKRGIMYFGNTNGLLEFDGTNCRLIRPGTGTIVPSVSAGNDGTVYVGSTGDFGYLKPDSSGTMQYVSLKEKIPAADREFAQIWRIVPTPQGVYFSSYQRLFRLNHNGTIRSWKPEKKFGKAFYLLNSLYVRTVGKGLLRLEGDELVHVPGGELFADQPVNDAVNLTGEALLATNMAVYRLSPTGVQPEPFAALPQMANALIYSMQTLPGGEIALGTRKSGLILLSAEGKIDRTLTSEADGLPSDTVYAIYPDRQGGIWLTGENGIARFNPGYSYVDKTSGLEGEVRCMTRQGGTLYAGTTKGTYRMVAEGQTKPHFQHVDGIDFATNTLAPYRNGLIAATERGLFLIDGTTAKLMIGIGVPLWDVVASTSNPDVIYTAGRTGVFMVRRERSGWKKSAELLMPQEEFRSVLEDTDGRVWATTQKEVFRLDFRADPVRPERFGKDQGIPPGWITARRLDDHVVFATDKGLRRFSESLHRFAPDITLGERFGDGSRDVLNIFESPAGDVWITGGNDHGASYHGLLSRHGNQMDWKPMPLLPLGIREIYWLSLDDDAAWVIDDTYVLQRFAPALAGDPDKEFRVLTRAVEITSNRKTLFGGAGGMGSVRLPHHENALRFSFAAPFYEDPSSIEYQYQLEGSDATWSDWTHETKKEYTHLPRGPYRFRVRARSPHGVMAEQENLAFSIAPPWYATWWAYTIYAILGAFGVWGVVRLRTRQLEEDKRKLEVIVEERTVEIREQRDEIKEQERKSHSLLLNILPATVADELKSTGMVQPVGFDDVTVCFTDFVGFTLSSEHMQPSRLVDALNEYFTRFDEIIARYGLEKLKTIGDSYMFASGLPTPRESHAVDAVLAAMEMVEVVKELAARADGTGWNIRVGLHSGPVVAGVVGTKKFAFDIWGHTVNFAARMESSGKPGHVNMSERTCRLTRDLIDCECRGQIKIKEGRELTMFLARNPVDDFAARYEREFGHAAPDFHPGTAVGLAVVSAS